MKFVFDLILSLACTSSLLLTPSMQAIILAADFSTPKVSDHRLQPTEIGERKIRDIARQITVRILWGETGSGSGILITQQKSKQSPQSDYRYLVLTNNHVISNPNSEYWIETPDGRIHKALPHSQANEKFKQKNLDLGLLWFSSPMNYGKAQLGDSSSLQNEDEIYVGGFPCQDRRCEEIIEFKLSIGAGLIINKPLVDGYQVAYTNETSTGASGGPVLNKKGQVVAIHGQGKYPSNNKQYNYAAGDKPPQEVIKFMKYFAWGIPINTYKSLIPKSENLLEELPPSEKDNVIKYVPYGLKTTSDSNDAEVLPEMDRVLYLLIGLLFIGIVGLFVFIVLSNKKYDKIFKEIENIYKKIKNIEESVKQKIASLKETQIQDSKSVDNENK